MTDRYLNFINSVEFMEIITKTDEEIADEKFCFIDKLFPVTYDETGHDSFVINIRELRTSDKYENARIATLQSLNLFLEFFGIKETGVNKVFLLELSKLKHVTVRILRSLMYHGLYTNASLFAFRLIKFRIFFRDLEEVRTIWERTMRSCIQEIEAAGFEYREPSISKYY